jgi:hypothetical protein
MKKVISLALFNNVKQHGGGYNQFFPALIRGYVSLFPNWEIRIYHDESLYNSYYGSVLVGLQSSGIVRLDYVPDKHSLCQAMLWRMMPLWDPTVDYFICRDIDHTPTGRERQAVELFISSGQWLHCINDNPNHDIPMLGGMIGFKVKEVLSLLKFPDFGAFIHAAGFLDSKWQTHGSDQIYLNALVWILLRDHSYLHRLRWNMPEPKSPECHFKLAPIEIKDVHADLLVQTDEHCMCIGTPPINIDIYTELVEKYGAQDKLAVIRSIEKKLKYIVRGVKP